MMITCEPKDIPQFLSREDVPLYFPQFQRKCTLAYLAHKGIGPLYNLVGRRAFYATVDIWQWLEKTKRPGPNSQPIIVLNSAQSKPVAPKPVTKKVGRPSKIEQMARKG